MAGTPGTDWIWLASGALLGLIGLAMLIWALFWDRSKGRKRCPRCWYDMQAPGKDPLTCPECGQTVRHERKLRKTRRRLRWAFIATICIVSAPCIALRPKIARDGWTSIIPSSLLARMYPLYEYGWDSSVWRGDLFTELGNRIETGDGWSDEHWATLLERVLRGQARYLEQVVEQIEESEATGADLIRRPIEEFAEDVYQGLTLFAYPFGRDVHRVILDAGLWENYAAASPFHVRIVPRDRWPEGMPLSWRLEIESFGGPRLFSRSTAVISATVRGVETQPSWLPSASGIRFDWWCRETLKPQGVSAPEPGKYTIDFDVTIYAFRAGPEGSSIEAQERALLHSRHIFTRTLVIGGSIDDILDPIRDEAVDRQIASLAGSLRFRNCWPITPNAPDHHIEIVLDQGIENLMPETAMFPRMELRREQDVVADVGGTTVLTMFPSTGKMSVGGLYFELPSATSAQWRSAAPGERWTIRIYGSGEDAIRKIESGTYWAGAFEFDVDLHAVMNCELFEAARFDD